MTEQQYNQAVDAGQVQQVDTPTQPVDQPVPEQPFDDNEPVLASLKQPRRHLTSAPTFTPKTFADSVQFFDDGTTKKVYFYFNGAWNEIRSLTFPADPTVYLDGNGNFTTPAATQVAFDNALWLGDVSSGPFSFTCAGANRVLIVSCLNLSGDRDPDAVTYAGASLTKLTHVSGGSGRLSLWYKVGPTIGANNVAVTPNGVDTIYGTVSSWKNSSGVFRNTQTNYNGATTSDNLTVTCAASSMVIDALGTGNNYTMSVDAGQSAVATGNANRGQSYVTGASPSRSMGWSEVTGSTKFWHIATELVAGTQ